MILGARNFVLGRAVTSAGLSAKWRAVRHSRADGYVLERIGSHQDPEPTESELLAALLSVDKSAKVLELSYACAAEVTAGFTSSALGAQHRYDSDLESQLNLLGAASLGVDVPYTCTDGLNAKEARLHTPAQMQQVLLDGAAVKIAALAKFRGLKNQVLAAADSAAVAAIFW